MIKSTQQSKTNTKPSYPKLMENYKNDLVVLFWSPEVGVVVRANHYHAVGHYSNDWRIGAFSDYKGQITLENTND